MIVEMTGIHKSFSGNPVLKDVSFTLEKGEIHALMGENGAGKSTLMKILTGIYERDSGTVKIKGREVHYKHPKEAEADGLAVIHQELNILPELTVAENLFVGKERTYGKTGWIKSKEMNRLAEEKLAELGLKVKGTERAGNLSVGKQQLIEIAKALMTNADIIIMDEPTAALTDREIDTLFATVRELQKKGVTFVYISHRMEEIFSLCQRITVLRDGEYVGTKVIAETSFDEIVKMMVGRALGNRFPEHTLTPGDVKLEIKHLTRAGEFENVSLSVRAGEILGISGLMGAGRSELVETIFGYRKADSGEVWIDGKQAAIKGPDQAIAQGIGFVSEDRKSKGLIVDFSIRDNISLTNLSRISTSSWISSEKERSLYEELAKKLHVKASGPSQQAKSLSGGNQQKIVIAKWLGIEPKILILDEPTRGVDVGAKKEIYTIMNELAKQGVAIIMVSSELPEVIGLSTRVAVMFEGKLMHILERDELSEETIMHYATGGDKHVRQ
ncbi:sugar ABC transporter ATP-binding protein [Halalkalibacterium halodurans]|uniref:Ribose import ATP-binding protein RbsA n=1 Tax=Halalkalibacterium halodurans (strain ATCC BAA-125 / DSM 18197 / FERM 7344 / JCM 9153 / C-125) TaxID=272558 RepID=RBSA_HALH5|nr:sugar ABC transporter ATP-binding protein [Halalkalibacterium halodurans]Q9K6J9.1 RecName: Full=Ribose import ATP-binding protein RbsA [Halalkalibacterium halodurans C-125]MDY7224235.1 sugar ABC transporter ATP-binding protein [Halalkalibacterium halodurans]MDY7243520.1 sugar ABC transporter ATP-binding protein [Halalkalibacterium halodurans]MED3647246.1 sugar ABC transporter ATP-binding protein [Halalkalibacterium halodurans]MED4123415.1 sugar ABC transporter ATP-binding protein [Halalkali